MRCSALCVLLLTISEPLFIHAKVVLVVPRQIRRSPAISWRPSSTHYKKSSYTSNDFHRPSYYGSALASHYYSKKPFRPLPYPHGGDDFDQGHEAVNHVHIPYGKDVSHGISFGKGYIPYENIKTSSLPYVHERYAGAYVRQPVAPDYAPTDFTSVGQEYTASATATHSYEGPQVDSFFSDMESATHGDNIRNTADKYYASRSIGKDLTLRNQHTFDGSSVTEREKDSLAMKSTEDFLAKDASPVAYSHAAGTSGAVILPAGIPPTTIAGNKDGIVLRDTVSLDEYHRKLEELTKTWPGVLSTGTNAAASFAAPIHQPLQAMHQFPTGGLVGAGFAGGPTGGAGWLASLQAQSKQGYAVREDHGDSTTHDFRTMPIHAGASSYPHFAGMNAAVRVRAFAPNFHG